jgi:hypothetical protein
VVLLAHSSAIEIDDILKDFSPHRAVRAHETDIYREDFDCREYPARVYILKLPHGGVKLQLPIRCRNWRVVDLVEARIIAPPWRLRAEPFLSRGSSSNAPFRDGIGHSNIENNKLTRPEATPDWTGHAIGRSDRTRGRNAHRS